MAVTPTPNIRTFQVFPDVPPQLEPLLELAGNLPSFDDRVVHPTINVDDLDPACDLP